MSVPSSEVPGPKSRERAVELLCLSVVFLLAVLAVDPRGEFPLDDDWDFAFVTWNFAQTGHLQFTPFTAATLRAQVFWGAVWSRLFGPSFQVLRASTLFLSLMSLLLLNAFLASLKVPRFPRLAMTLALLFHPIFFWASFTYMTHIPFVFLSLVSLVFFTHAFIARKPLYALAGAAAVVLSFLVRQTGVVNALPPILLAIHMRQNLGRDWWKRYLLPPLAALATFVVLLQFTSVFVPAAGEHALHRKVFEWSGGAVLWNLLIDPYHHTAFNFMNGALFALPIVAAMVVSGPRPTARKLLTFAAVAAAFLYLGTLMIQNGNPFPYRNGGNVFTNLGLGPHTLRDTFHLGYLYPAFHLEAPSRAILTLGAAILGAFLLVTVAAAVRKRPDGTGAIGALLATYYILSGSLILCFIRIYFDRYSLDALWPVVLFGALTVNWEKRRSRIAATTLILFLGAFSISATQEYLAWNRARWEAYRYLRSGGVGLEQMDGGYEINALLALRTGRKNLGKKGFGVMDDEYLITFNPIRGYRPLAVFPYPRVFGLDQGVVFALRRVSPQSPQK